MKRIITILLAISIMFACVGNVAAQEFNTDKFEKFLCLHACYCKGELFTKPISDRVCEIHCVNHGKKFVVDLDEYLENGWCIHENNMSADGSRCLDCKQVFTYKNSKIDAKESLNYIGPSSNICSHPRTIEYMAAGNTFDDVGKCISEGYFITYSDVCQTEISNPEYKRTEAEHNFINGKCTGCHCDEYQDQNECYHKNTDESFTGNVSKTNNGTIRAGYYIRYCNDCGRELSEPTYDERFTKHEFSSGNKCSLCGYVLQEKERQAWTTNTGENLLLRSEPYKGNNIIGRIPEGSIIVVIGDTVSNGYRRVNFNGKVGWAHGDWISFTTKPETQTTVSNSSYILPFSSTYGRITVLEYYWGRASSGVHPTKGVGNIRGAVDFAVTGSALATASGTVVEAKTGYNSGWGNYVTLRHDDGTYSFYAHLSKISVFVNQKASQGQAIGTIGSTGNSTGVHLHFEIWNNQKQTIYTIDALKDKYKDRLRFDSDVVSGGSNSSSIRNWIQNNYTLNGNVYVPKANSTPNTNVTVSTPQPSAPQQTTQSTTIATNKKANFVQSQISVWQSLLESKKQAAENCLSVSNEVNARLSIQQALGVSISAVTTLSPTKLFSAVDEDVALYTLAAIINNEYKTIADSNYYAFLGSKNKITNDLEATKIYTYFVEALASYDFILKGTYDAVSQFATGGEYTKRMLDKFVLGLVEGYVESDVVKLKKLADSVQNMSSLLETIKNKSVGLKQYYDTKNQWQAIWDKL